MRKLSLILLILLPISVYADDKKEVVVGSAEELKGIDAKKITWKKDNSEMALIPAGSFEMGNAKDWMRSGQPVHTVELNAFYMDIKEVTMGQYKRFLVETGRQALPDFVPRYAPTDEHPALGVNWFDALAYCKWAGKRLPTEAEWEYAARGGLKGKRYPWGDEITHDDANYDGTGGWDKWQKPAPVGSFMPNGYSLYDVTGNVWEWCQDWYDSDRNTKVLRGGAWNRNTGYLRIAYRNHNSPQAWINSYGFRCVADVK